MQDVSFTVARGETVGFLGPNGAGKTTILRMLTCFFPPDAGTATVAGHDLRDSLAVRASVGYLPEANPLYGEMQAQEYLLYRARLKGLDRSRARNRLVEIAQRLDLIEILDRRQRIANLSKGQRQRVGLADALLPDPPVLLLDEPTMGLDPNQIRETRALIRALSRDKAILLSSHILSEVEALCSRVVILHRGRVLAEGTADEIARKVGASGRIRVEMISEPEAARQALRGIRGVTGVECRQAGGAVVCTVEVKAGEDPRAAVYELAVSRGWPLRALTWDPVSLEEAFSRLTAEKNG